LVTTAAGGLGNGHVEGTSLRRSRDGAGVARARGDWGIAAVVWYAVARLLGRLILRGA
jgi:hypothetical protein